MWRTIVAVVAGLSATAGAGPKRDPEATRLFDEGRDLAKLGRFAEACQRFSRSLQLAPAAGTELNLGDCEEHLGHLADAWRAFDDAEAMFAREGDASRAAFAHDRAKNLAPRLATILISLTDPQDTDGVIIAGREVTPTARIREQVDPGEIEIRISPRAKPAITRVVHVDAGDTRVVSTAMPEPEAPPEVAPAVTKHPQPPSNRSSRVRIAWVLAGAGVAAAGIGLGLGLQGRSDYQAQLDDGHCSTASGRLVCNTAGYAATNDAVTRADVGTGFALAGAALAVTGAVVYATAPRATSVAPVVTGQLVGVVLARRF